MIFKTELLTEKHKKPSYFDKNNRPVWLNRYGDRIYPLNNNQFDF